VAALPLLLEVVAVANPLLPLVADAEANPLLLLVEVAEANPLLPPAVAAEASPPLLLEVVCAAVNLPRLLVAVPLTCSVVPPLLATR